MTLYMNQKENQNQNESDAISQKNLYIESMNKKNVNLMSMNGIVSLAWGAKEILRDDFKKAEWGKIILPFIVLRRLGKVLEPTREKDVILLIWAVVQKMLLVDSFCERPFPQTYS
jgi:hypothetical protein